MAAASRDSPDRSDLPRSVPLLARIDRNWSAELFVCIYLIRLTDDIALDEEWITLVISLKSVLVGVAIITDIETPGFLPDRQVVLCPA
jgi:hypothetical protein